MLRLRRFLSHATHAMSTHYQVVAECPVTKARVGNLQLAHGVVETPVFMPVGTNGTVKGITTDQLHDDPLGCQILLGNTYHLGHRPGIEIVQKAGGLHSFMNWDRNILTDSGGFQMVSLLALSEMTEEGVRFRSPHDDSMMLLTPERSMEIQLALGSDIIMQLDDVVHTLTTGDRLVEAMHRTIRWLDRCISVPRDADRHLLFSILQGGLNDDLRRMCAAEMVRRDSAIGGYAIGGLSGGESKQDFWRIVALSASLLPKTKPRYVMGVGYPEDLVVCAALGCDMFDCVWPTRTARFGHALTDELPFESDNSSEPSASTTECTTELGNLKKQQKARQTAVGQATENAQQAVPSKRCDAPKKRYADPYDVSSTINLTKAVFANDPRPISSTCSCYTCTHYSRALLHALVTKEPIGCSLVTIHNLAFQLSLMRRLRTSVCQGRFPEFVQDFMRKRYPSGRYPRWIIDALGSVNVTLT